MKKKLAVFLFTFTMLFSMAGCGQEEVMESVTDTLVVESEETVAETEKTKETAEVPEEAEESEETVVLENYDYSISISINPQITFYMVNDAVAAWIPDNSDAVEAFSGIDFKGMSAKEAISETVKVSNEKGYFKDNANVYITLASPTEIYGQDKIDEYITLTQEAINDNDLNGTAKSSVMQQVKTEEESAEESKETQSAQATTEKEKEKDKEKPVASTGTETANNGGAGTTQQTTDTSSEQTPSQPAAETVKPAEPAQCSHQWVTCVWDEATKKIVDKCAYCGNMKEPTITGKCSGNARDGFTHCSAETVHFSDDNVTITNRYVPHDKSECYTSEYVEQDSQGRTIHVTEWWGPAGDKIFVCNYCGGEVGGGSIVGPVRTVKYYEFTEQMAQWAYEGDWNNAYSAKSLDTAEWAEANRRYENGEITLEERDSIKDELRAQATAYANATVDRNDPKYQPYVINDVVYSDPAYNF